MSELKNEPVRLDEAVHETPVAGYEPPRVESVMTQRDVEREALYGGISRS